MTFDVTKFVKERNAFLVTHARSSISTIFKMRFYLDGRVGSQMKPKIILGRMGHFLRTTMTTTTMMMD